MLKSVSMRRGVLTVKISGRKSGERALFRVDRKQFMRNSNTLRVRLKAWPERPGRCACVICVSWARIWVV